MVSDVFTLQFHYDIYLHSFWYFKVGIQSYKFTS